MSMIKSRTTFFKLPAELRQQILAELLTEVQHFDHEWIVFMARLQRPMCPRRQEEDSAPRHCSMYLRPCLSKLREAAGDEF